MSRRRRRVRGIGALVIGMGIVVLLVSTPAVGASVPGPVMLPRMYTGAGFGADPEISPTQDTHQDKLWFHDGAWWALMLDEAGREVGIFELLPDHSWRPTGTVVSDNPDDTGDALPIGDRLVVAARHADETLKVSRLRYDDATRTYTPVGSAATVTDRGGANDRASLVEDSTGRLWAAFSTGTDVLVASSGDGGTSWTAPFTLASGGAPRVKTVAIAAFDRSVGVMWTEQTGGVVSFAIHSDGAAADAWSQEVAGTGPERYQDHLSLKVVDGATAASPNAPDTLVAALQTTHTYEGEFSGLPTIMVLVRAPDGRWSQHVATTIQDSGWRPVVQVDATDRSVHLLFESGQHIYHKRFAASDPVLVPGRGTPILVAEDKLVPTSSHHPVHAGSGLVVLAAGDAERRYHHAELPLGGAPPDDPRDTTPPGPPGAPAADVDAFGTVLLNWPAATDGDRWAPAADTAPVRGYHVYRDGIPSGVTPRISFVDEPPRGSTYTYTVRAVDNAGLESEPVAVRVDVPAGELAGQAIGGGFMTAAAATVLVALSRRRTNEMDLQTLIDGPRRESPPPATAPLLPAHVRRAVAVAAACSAFLLTVLAVYYWNGTEPGPIDEALADAMKAVFGPLDDPVLATIDDAGDFGAPATMVLLLAIVLAAAGRRRLALLAVLGPGATALLSIVLKSVVGRTYTGNLSFPSGHVAGLTAIAIVVALVVLTERRWSAVSTRLAIAGVALVAASMSVAQIVRHVHYPTDTVAALCAAVLCMLAVALLIDKFGEGGIARSLPSHRASRSVLDVPPMR